MELFIDEQKKFLFLLLKYDVEFILIGGHAVIYHGYARITSDMDIWLKPDALNRNKFISALHELGIMEEDIAILSKEDFSQAQVFHIGTKPNRIDFLTKIVGVTYEEADAQKSLLPLLGKEIPILHHEHLITNKLLSDRLKDRADVEELQKRIRFRNKE